MLTRTALFMLLSLAGADRALAAEPSKAELEHARRRLRQAVLFDGHNDLPWTIHTDKKALGDLLRYGLRRLTAGQADLARLGQGGGGAQL